MPGSPVYFIMPTVLVLGAGGGVWTFSVSSSIPSSFSLSLGGWLVVLGFGLHLRQYFSLYGVVFQREKQPLGWSGGAMVLGKTSSAGASCYFGLE